MKISTCSHRQVLVPCGLKDFDYQVDPYVGCEHYCYYCYVLQNAETDWTQEILIHQDIEGQLRGELDKIPPQKIYMGYTTDPYQPCEKDYRQTREALKLFLEKGFSAGILTKSDLVVRDVDVLKEMGDASVSVSVAFNDSDTLRLFEDNTLETRLRLEALGQLKNAGIKTSALICPVIPHITDVMQLVERLIPLTDVIWIYGLSIENPSDRNWENIKAILKHHFPEHQKEIEDIIFSKEHPYWARLRDDLNDIRDHRNINLKIHC